MPSPSLDSATSNAALAPLERVLLPAELDGRHGANRARGVRAQIAADRDIDAIKGWLARFADVKTTFDSYRKEAERLLLWSTVELRKPLSSLTHEDLLAYQRFLADPQPAAVDQNKVVTTSEINLSTRTPVAALRTKSSQIHAVSEKRIKVVTATAARRCQLATAACRRPLVRGDR